MDKKHCDVYFFSDMQKCIKCGLTCDVNDPCPPECALKSTASAPSLINRFFACIFGSKL